MKLLTLFLAFSMTSAFANSVIAQKNSKFSLSPSTRLAGQLLTAIIVSEEKQSQQVKVKALHDIYDEKGSLVVPKNSILKGKIHSFNADTGTGDITLNEAIIGDSTIKLNDFKVHSADLTPGLRGEIRDNQGKLVSGTFIRSFSSSALGVISQNDIKPANSELIKYFSDQTTLLSSNTIKEVFAGNIKDKSKIFYIPAGIKVITSAQ